MMRCPVCRAENAIGPACRRCRADLSLLEAVEARQSYHLSASAAALRDQRHDEALEQVQLADELRTGVDVQRARACSFLLAGDFSAALAAYFAADRVCPDSPTRQIP